MKTNLYLVAHRYPFEHVPGTELMLESVVVATITTDKRLLGKLKPEKILTQLAHKMGLLDFEVTASDARDLPGHQLGLPFPTRRKRK